MKALTVAARAIAPRPRLWGPALKLTARSTPRHWWRQRPFLPVPSAEYVRFRLLTQYGDAAAVPTVDDVVHYLEWCRDWD